MSPKNSCSPWLSQKTKKTCFIFEWCFICDHINLIVAQMSIVIQFIFFNWWFVTSSHFLIIHSVCIVAVIFSVNPATVFKWNLPPRKKNWKKHMITKIDDTFFSNIDCFIGEKTQLIAVIQFLHNTTFHDFINIIKQFSCKHFSIEKFITWMQKFVKCNHIKIFIMVERNIRHIHNHDICSVDLI